jgi:hypothetical protein
MALLGEIHRHMRMIVRGGRAFRQHERLFLARTDRVRRGLGDVAAMHASDGIAVWRWWTLAELDTAAEVIWPAGPAALIRSTLSRR